jgi:uncharacterized protein (DUF1697 family)
MTTKGNESVHVALLRGINLAGKNPVAMKELAALFSGAGCSNVRTYIQSGNVIFKASDALADRIVSVVGKSFPERFGFPIRMVTRRADELGRIARGNPFLAAGAAPATLHVVFLADSPTKAQIAALDPKRSPTDEFAVRGREIYLRCPNGFARTKLSNDYFDSKLGSVSTIRNWRTLLELERLATESE